ncbi:hypothetical protein BFW01_g7519 [Lasiodiplodia theobromae]|nr:hypothetical protein BFW01_g7519 [Lasiodiplodia theobromae]
MPSGTCLCGDIAVEYTGEPAVTALCHCVDCQKWTGAAFTSNIVVPRTKFRVLRGNPKAFDAIGASGKINKHFFCPRCGSNLYCELEIMEEMTVVKSGILDGGASNHEISVEFYNRDRLGYTVPVSNAAQKPEFS